VNHFYCHEFLDGSGTVLFDGISGETLVLSMSLADIETQVYDPESEIFLTLEHFNMILLDRQVNTTLISG